MDIYSEIYKELEHANAARASGNEGRARVCARRAAGIAAREFLTLSNIQLSSASHRLTRSGCAYEALQLLAEYPGLAPDLKQAAVYLTLRVTKEFSVPDKVDLIAEARKIIEGLI